MTHALDNGLSLMPFTISMCLPVYRGQYWVSENRWVLYWNSLVIYCLRGPEASSFNPLPRNIWPHFLWIRPGRQQAVNEILMYIRMLSTCFSLSPFLAFFSSPCELSVLVWIHGRMLYGFKDQLLPVDDWKSLGFLFFRGFLSFAFFFFFWHFCLRVLIFEKEVKGKCTGCYMAAEQKWKYFQESI